MFVYSAFADEISPDLETQIKVLKEYNVKHIEARGINGKNIADYSVSEMKEIKKVLDESDIEISALGSPIGKIKMTDNFDDEIEKFKNILELSHVLSAKYIRIFSFYMNDEDKPLYREKVFERLSKYIKIAKGHNITLLHENEKGIYGDNAIRCKEILDTLNCDYLKATFDPANFVQIGQNTLEAFDILEDYIEYMHIKDAKICGEIVPSGYGDGNVKEILKRLRDKNWSGFLSLEPHLGDFVGFSDLEENAEKCKKPSDADLFDIAYKSLDKIVREV